MKNPNPEPNTPFIDLGKGQSCKHLISDEFTMYMNRAFHIETHKTTSRKRVKIIVRAYYVFKDIQYGFGLDVIEKTRLKDFHSFLWSYILHQKHDKKAEELWDICNNALADRS